MAISYFSFAYNMSKKNEVYHKISPIVSYKTV